jgi:hypothetical protein
MDWSTPVAEIMRRERHRAANEEGGRAEPDPLAAASLSPEAEAARRTVTLSYINPVGRRAVAVFLDRDDYEKVHERCGGTMANLLMGCLPDFIAQQNGEIALTALFANRGDDVLNPITFAMEVDGEVRHVVTEGYVFIHSPEERVVVSANMLEGPAGLVSHLVVRSNRDSAGFFRRWRQFARAHNHLRGRSFFADGAMIERKRRYTWDDILLPESVKRTVRTQVAGFLANRTRLRALGVKARRGLILEGPPGTGKTLLGKVLADTLDVSFMWVSPRHVESPHSFAEMLKLARFVAPTVLFLEDLDLFAKDREASGWMGLGELMNQLDGAIDNEDLITIATTNRLQVVEDALRNRPGRFDRVLTLDEMDEGCRRRLLGRMLARAIGSAEDMDHLVAATKGCTGAQIEELANTLYILAVDRSGDSVGGGDGGGSADPLEGGNGDGIGSNDITAAPVAIDRGLIDLALEEVRGDTGPRMGFRVA